MGFSGTEKNETMSFAENGCNWMEIMTLNELSQYQKDNMFSSIYGPKTLYSHMKPCILYKMKVFRETKVINRKEGERKGRRRRKYD